MSTSQNEESLAMQTFLNQMQDLMSHFKSKEGKKLILQYSNTVRTLNHHYHCLLEYLEPMADDIDNLRELSFPRDVILQVIQSIETVMSQQQIIVSDLTVELESLMMRFVSFPSLDLKWDIRSCI